MIGLTPIFSDEKGKELREKYVNLFNVNPYIYMFSETRDECYQRIEKNIKIGEEYKKCFNKEPYIDIENEAIETALERIKIEIEEYKNLH